MFLPFKHCINVELQLQDGSDKWAKWFIARGLECPEVVLYRVMEFTKLFPCAVFRCRCIQYHARVSLVNELWAVVTRLKTINGFGVVFARSGQTLYCLFCRSILECMLKVHQLLRLG